MLQRWQSLTFLHWRYEPATIRPLVPRTVELDTFDGAAWVALTPFLLTDLRPPLVPSLPWISRFPETNVRTYVRGPDGKPGVWFFTLEADRLLAVLAARATFGLPYRWARMRVSAGESRVEYASDRRRWFGSGFSRIAVRPGDPIELQPFDNFLTARYRLYAIFGKRLAFAEIEHARWPLRRAEVLRLDQNLFVNSGVPQPLGEPVAHFSPSLDVRIGRLRRIK